MKKISEKCIFIIKEENKWTKIIVTRTSRSTHYAYDTTEVTVLIRRVLCRTRDHPSLLLETLTFLYK